MTPKKRVSICEHLRERAWSHPNQVLYRWLADGEFEGGSLTPAELDERACAIATHLQRALSRGERALLLYPPGLEFIAAFFGCIYSSVIAVPAYAPRNPRQLKRIMAILHDAQPTAILSTSNELPSLEKMLRAENIEKIQWIATDEIGLSASDPRQPNCDEHDVLYLQYTSGSTSVPKGVMISNSNVLANLESIASVGGFSGDSVTVSWLPHFHDMGLVYSILQPIFSGFQAYLFAPSAFIQQPLRWLRGISRYRGTHCGGPDFAYALCVERISDSDRDALDLSSWRVAFNGAEPVRLQTIERFAQKFGRCGFQRTSFYPVYGLAEATLKVTSVVPDSGAFVQSVQTLGLRKNRFCVADENNNEAGQKLVGCGAPSERHLICVVDPETHEPAPPGQIGEIWVSGPSVAQGYWNKPKETKDIFHAQIHNQDRRYLRTGDLGIFHDGQLFIAGRIKDCIIIRGSNHYPQDIEFSVQECHPALMAAGVAAFSCDIEDEERLVIQAEIHRRNCHDCEEVVSSIRRAVEQEYEVQVYAVELVKQRSLPRTPSGKMQRHLCRTAFLDGSLPALHRWQTISRTKGYSVAGIAREETALWPEVERDAALVALVIKEIQSSLNLTTGQVTAEDIPAGLGMDSLRAAEIAHRIERIVGYRVAPAWFTDGRSVQEIARAVRHQMENSSTASPIQLARHSSCFGLSYGQRALWFLQQMRPESTAWNITRALKIRGLLDAGRLRNALEQVIWRHPALRTTFCLKDGEPVQQVHESCATRLELIDATRFSEEELHRALEKEAKFPFVLDKPLLRVCLFPVSSREHVLLMSVHHVISDLWSLQLFYEEFARFYGGASDDAVAVEYFEFVEWQQHLLESDEGKMLWEYWVRKLSGTLPVTRFLPDEVAEPKRERVCESQIVRMDRKFVELLKRRAAEEQTTCYAMLLTIFLGLLHRETGEDALLIGTPVHGREHAAFAATFGYFVNTLPIRVDLNGRLIFRKALHLVSDTLSEGLARAALPFPLIVEKLRNERDSDLSPLIHVMFSYLAVHSGNGDLGALAVADVSGQVSFADLKAEVMDVQQHDTQLDVWLSVAECNGTFISRFEYDSTLYCPERMARIASHFLTLARNAVETPGAEISNLAMLTPQEHREILLEWNSTARDYAEDMLVQDLVHRQALATPGCTAVSFEGADLSYAELDSRSTRLARFLVAQYQAGPESVVAVCGDRSPELVVTLLGILKSGAAYLPLDPEQPQERLEYMLSTAKAKLVLCQPQYVGRLEGYPAVAWDVGFRGAGDAAQVFIHRPNSENLAYVIFTSGSTGKPKGAMLHHRGLINMLLWMKEHYLINPADTFLQKTPFTFDVSVWEFFLPLISGARLVVAAPGGHRDSGYLVRLIQDQTVTTVHFSPRLLAMMLDDPAWLNCTSLQRVICIGEALPADLQQRFFETSLVELHNVYGPTETSVEVSAWRCRREDRGPSVPIGKPIANTQLYILDTNLQPVPIGCPGEIYIGGIPVGRGYANRPDVTAAAFLPDPWSSLPGRRFYRTGDWAKYDLEGNIIFIGRRDAQVKIRGWRVELGEIETAICGQPGVKKCAVLLDPEERLTAYVVFELGAETTGPRIKSAMENALPHYMVPTRFFSISHLPLSTSGKLDRAALRTMGTDLLPAAMEHEEEESLTEKQVKQIWSELLGEQISSIHENFFRLGGHSLLVTHMAIRIQETFGIDLPLSTVFKGAGTVQSIAAAIDKAAQATAEVAQNGTRKYAEEPEAASRA